MKAMLFNSLAYSPEETRLELLELAALCQKLKDGEPIPPLDPHIAAIWSAIEKTTQTIEMLFYSKTRYLDFLIALLEDEVPLNKVYNIECLFDSYKQYLDSKKGWREETLIAHYTQWKKRPKSIAAWDFFIQRVYLVYSGFFKDNLYKIEDAAAALGCDLTVEQYHQGLFELNEYKGNATLDYFEALFTRFHFEALHARNKQANKDLFHAVCLKMSLKSAFILKLTDSTYSGLHRLFNCFWVREMVVVFEKMRVEMSNSAYCAEQYPIADFFQLWLKNKYPKFLVRIIKPSSQLIHLKKKWSFRQVVRYLPPCVLLQLGKFEQNTWQYAFLVHLAKGGSPRKFELPPQYQLSKKAAHLFVTAEMGMSLEDSLRSALMSSWDASMVLQTKLHEYVVHYSPAFWERVMRFFVRENPPSWYRSYNSVFNYINHIIQETGDFNFKGRTLVSLERAYQEWQAEIENARKIRNAEGWWLGANMADMTFKNARGGTLYRFVQLKTSRDLAIEGSYMNHCVAGYTRSCMEGYASIWSLRRIDKKNQTPLVTVEVRDKQVVQARRAYNQMPYQDEIALIKQWADTEGVRFETYF